MDSRGYSVSGIDANEKFGTLTNDTSNNWIAPQESNAYLTGSLAGDQIGHVGGVPAATAPSSPLGSARIRHIYPWTLRVGSITSGLGTPGRVDTSQEWLDHGTHQ